MYAVKSENKTSVRVFGGIGLGYVDKLRLKTQTQTQAQAQSQTFEFFWRRKAYYNIVFFRLVHLSNIIYHYQWIHSFTFTFTFIIHWIEELLCCEILGTHMALTNLCPRMILLSHSHVCNSPKYRIGLQSNYFTSKMNEENYWINKSLDKHVWDS